jgi:hypothetical protein
MPWSGVVGDLERPCLHDLRRPLLHACSTGCMRKAPLRMRGAFSLGLTSVNSEIAPSRSRGVPQKGGPAPQIDDEPPLAPEGLIDTSLNGGSTKRRDPAGGLPPLICYPRFLGNPKQLGTGACSRHCGEGAKFVKFKQPFTASAYGRIDLNRISVIRRELSRRALPGSSLLSVQVFGAVPRFLGLTGSVSL